MTITDITQLIATLGFPIVLVGAFLIFFDQRAWPWFIAFMEKYLIVLQTNTTAVQTMTSAIAAIADAVKAQPNADLAIQTAVLMIRMNEQHLGLSQQLSAVKGELVLKIDNNMSRIVAIEEIVRK